MEPLVKIGLLIVVGLVGLGLAAHFFWAGKKSAADDGDLAFLNIGQTETHNSLSSSSTSCSSDNSSFSSRHVVLMADNPHPLSRQIAARLERLLKDCPFIECLEVTNQTFLQTEGTNSPDLFVNVNLVELKQSGLISSTMKSVVTASLGSTPWQSSIYASDSSTPPLVAFTWNGTMDSETTFTGIRTDRYADTAQKVAEDFAKAISKQLEELSGKYPPLPELPGDFYGPYQPVADFDCLKEFQARRAATFCGLLTHNQTFWQFQTETNPVPQLQRIIGALETAGWKFRDVQLTNTLDYRMRGNLGDAELEIFRQRDEPMNPLFDEKPKTHFDFITHYRKSFSRAEREAAVEKLFEAQRPVEVLLPFQPSFSSSQRKRFYELVENSPVTSPRACIQLAQIYLDRKRTNNAINLLTSAKALAATVKDASSLESSIDSVAKKISPKKTLKLEVTPEICRKLGFLELTNLTQTVEQTRDLGQPLIFFGPGKRGIQITAFTIGARQKDAYPWLRVQAEEGMRSTSSSSFSANSKGELQHPFTFDEQPIKISAVPLPDLKQVKFTLQTGS